MALNPYDRFIGDRDPIDILADVPARLEEMTAAWTPDRWERSYAPGKWTARQILMHLAEGEAMMSVRIRMALAQDGYVFQPFDQEKWLGREPAAVTGPLALAAFLAMRGFELPLFRSLTPADRARVCRHPERGDVTVDLTLRTLAGHDLNHLAQLEQIDRAR
ncbi:MAG: DinB family protein [Acidobacteriota bacterium]|nr:DinB family protein [Acidobacteriota bacterium]